MQTKHSHLCLCQTGKIDINVIFHFMLFLKMFSKADSSRFFYVSKNTTFLCTIYEINTKGLVRSGSFEEYKPCSLPENEDSTPLLQFPSWLNGTVRWLICPLWNHKTVLQTVKNWAEWVKFQLRIYCLCFFWESSSFKPNPMKQHAMHTVELILPFITSSLASNSNQDVGVFFHKRLTENTFTVWSNLGSGFCQGAHMYFFPPSHHFSSGHCR